MAIIVRSRQYELMPGRYAVGLMINPDKQTVHMIGVLRGDEIFEEIKILLERELLGGGNVTTN